MKGGRIRVVKREPLGDVEINAALAFGEEEPAWVALIQLLERAKADCVETAVTNLVVNDPAVINQMAGWDHLDGFEKELFDRREKGLNAAR